MANMRADGRKRETLPMANGETIAEIKNLLAEGDKTIPTKTALRLSLDLQLQIYERQVQQENKYKALEERLEKQERTNIVMWVQNNPKLSIFLVTVYLIVASMVSWKDVVAKALGVK